MAEDTAYSKVYVNTNYMNSTQLVYSTKLKTQQQFEVGYENLPFLTNTWLYLGNHSVVTVKQDHY